MDGVDGYAAPGTEHATVVVMWRPGCPYCPSLRRGLSKAGVLTQEHDIWASPEAAARVRTATGGDETVPTVFVGSRVLVNPSVSQVRAAGWSLLFAMVWWVLATGEPTTTWHLAPALVAGATVLTGVLVAGFGLLRLRASTQQV